MLRFRVAQVFRGHQNPAIVASMTPATGEHPLPSIFFDLKNNQAETTKVLNLYFRTHLHATKFYLAVPEFFLVSPTALESVIPDWESDKLIFKECAELARARNGNVAVFKRTNAGLSHCWFELMPMPFKLGDALNEHSSGILYHLVREFLRFAGEYPERYGDMRTGLERDADLALILREVNSKADELNQLLDYYVLSDLVSFDAKWPLGQLKHLLSLLNNSSCPWSDLLFEHLMDCMSKKRRVGQ